MGNYVRRGTGILGTNAECPICKRKFNLWTTFNNFNSHIDACLQKGPPPKKSFDDSSINNSDLYDPNILSLKQKCEDLKVPWTDNHVYIIIERENLVYESLNQINQLGEYEIRSEFQIFFSGEIAQDAGGLMKEWLNLLMAELLSESWGMFVLANTQEVAYTIPIKEVESLSMYYYLFGRAIGKALLENVPINCHLSKVIFKHILQLRVELEDLRYIDEELYKSLCYMLQNPINGVFFETFSVKKRHLGDEFIMALVQDGQNIEVNDANKEEYAIKRAELELHNGFYEAIENIKNGFYFVVPFNVISHLTPEELEQALCGIDIIDIVDWQLNTEYKSPFSENHKVIVWFWKILRRLSQSQLSNLLVFVTGTSRLPIGGFTSLKTLRGDSAKFTIESVKYVPGILPRAHTCFNRLDLPIYQSKKELKKALLFVIENHSIGFGLDN
ncbi:unnamed protein product [Blepharisma stoltei]|uniref:HECT-type E3 ubiquitin transferase n=1 Tax=Blepharisma stoltei TaxID=1481888 RepID=A0AAU9JPL4_9CILI|nr:unnamed protein product [Blepharisma stoltei]